MSFYNSFLGIIRRVPAGLLIAFFGLCLIAAIWQNVLQHSASEYANEIEGIYVVNDALARAFEEHVRRALKTADDALVFLKMEYEDHGTISGSMIDFVDATKKDPILNQISLADAQGDIVFSAVPLKSPINIAKNELFRTFVQKNTDELLIGKPIITRVSGTWSFFLGRRLNRPDGSFGGTVSVGMDPEYFSDFYNVPEMGADRGIALVGRDGIVRARRFREKSAMGQDLSGSVLFELLRNNEAGHFEWRGGHDYLPRFASYRALQDYPLIVVVTSLKSAALASFEQRKAEYYLNALIFTGLITGFCLVAIYSGSRIRRQNVRLAGELSERKQAEEKLRISEERFRTIFENSAVGIVIADMACTILNCNPAMLSMLGYTGDELIGKNVSVIRHPEEDMSITSLLESCGTEQKESYEMQTRYVRRDGSVIWGFLSVSFVRDAQGNPEFLVAMVQDITERRKKEEEVINYQKQLQRLMYETTLLEERERKRIADELHDTIGQNLSFAQMKLSTLGEFVSDRGKEPMKEIMDLMEQTVQFSRSMTHELGNPVLYLVGLDAGIRWLGEQIGKNHGIPVVVDIEGDLSDMRGEVKVLLYKTVRELLFNVVKHAQADKVFIAIRNAAENLEITVTDNGVGINLDAIKSYGLFSVTERIKYLGGTIDIEANAAGTGTRISIVVPWSKTAMEEAI